MRPSTPLRGAGLAVALAGSAVAFGHPRFTWGNAGLQVWHPPIQGLAPLAGAVALGLGAAGLRPRALRLGGSALAVLLLALGGQRLAFRLDAIETGVAQRGLLGTTQLAWADVDHVESRLSELVITGKDGTRLRVPTRSFPPEDRARLERTIARRVRETASAGPPPAPRPVVPE